MKYIFLTNDFYRAYRHCPEIEQKQQRPYIQVQIVIDGVIFAIPLRSNINHPHVHWTDKPNRCGVDFSKAVVVEDKKYIDPRSPHIRPNEFKALQGKEYIITKKFQKYIENYKKAKSRPEIPRNAMLCEYSTLKYFEQYL